MPILKVESVRKASNDRETLRVYPVTTKLTKEERNVVTKFAESRGVARGQWIRDVILAQLQHASRNNAALAEILGIRLLLVNVLRPLAAGQKLTPETFDKLLDEIGTAKYDLAGKLVSERRR
ncbi:MAG: hypothetical protein P4M04_08960 [Acidobacteriota bacterium]|nr:hypothetical protein [Acidobacteriota bacterium]